MAHFYGKLQGGRGAANRQGHKNSGIRAWIQSWGTRVTVMMDHDKRSEIDRAIVRIGDGPTSYSGWSFVLTFDDLDALRRAAATDGDTKLALAGLGLAMDRVNRCVRIHKERMQEDAR